jgi:DNA polymerase-3 subunit delta'
VVIVDGAEDLNAQSANALLKVLEEPPPRAVLILVCSAAGRLLPTIRSRCRHLVLPPLNAADMDDALTTYLPDLPPGERATLAAIAEGSPGRALTLAAEGGVKLAGMVAEILREGPAIDLARGYEIADPAQRRLIQSRSPAHWAETAQSLSRLADETERANMDRRQALIAGLALLRGA